MIFSFGQSEHDHIEIDVINYERQPVREYYDDNWLVVEIRVHAGGFRGKVSATILAVELDGFLSKLRPLYQTLDGSAELTTLESQLTLQMTADGKGHIELRGEVVDQPGVGNRLRFTLQFDESQLAVSIRELERVVAQFPVRSV